MTDDENTQEAVTEDDRPSERVRCHCVGMFGQRCFACDPDGTMYGAVLRRGLAVRIDTCV